MIVIILLLTGFNFMFSLFQLFMYRDQIKLFLMKEMSRKVIKK